MKLESLKKKSKNWRAGLTKAHLYHAEAERLFVIEQMGFEEIITRLPISNKTLQRWKAQGQWQEKREQFRKSRQAFHDELYEFSRCLMKTIKDDMQNGEKIDQGRFYTLAKLIPQITKVKEYEDVVTKKETKQEKGLTKEIIEMIEEEVLGIRRD